jgi:hypothetical protein
MKLIFLYGLPATGKLTVARELAALTGYRLFHNHLTVDLLLSVFDFGSPAFVNLREEIWLSVFSQAAQSGLPGLIFTFCPESTVRPQFLPNLLANVRESGTELIFVEITSPVAVLKERMAGASRQQHGKLTSVELFEELLAKGIFASDHMPAPALTVDTSRLSPAESAEFILKSLALPRQDALS